MEKKFGKVSKEHMVRELSEKIASCPNILVGDFSHLGVEKITQLRKELRKKSSKVFFIKKSVARQALKENNMDKVSNILQGSTGFVFCPGDPIITSKIIFEFAKENQTLNVLGGYLDGRLLDAQKVKQISKLPSKQVIIQRLLLSMSSPLYGFVNVLGANLKGFINIVSQLKEKKEK